MATKIDTVQFISSLHGQQRRRERNIDRRDLEAAIAEGERELQQPRRKGQLPRWKITWGDVVYITDYDLQYEITSWALPLPLQKVPLDDGKLRQIREMQRRLEEGETAITSHTILVVDQSGSMMRADVAGHRNRSRCVFYNIAMEIISAPLLAQMVFFTDVVTIIQMRDEAEIIVDQQSASWLLFNRVVDLANQAERDARLRARERRACGPGNFIPAIELASKAAQATVERSVLASVSSSLCCHGRCTDFVVRRTGVDNCLLVVFVMKVRHQYSAFHVLPLRRQPVRPQRFAGFANKPSLADL